MKNKKKYLAIITLILTMLILIVYQQIKLNEYTKITQLGEMQENRQSMGYIIKTKNEKVIVVDGGLVEDTDNLINQINANGGKVNYWFLTHEHDDHVRGFYENCTKYGYSN